MQLQATSCRSFPTLPSRQRALGYASVMRAAGLRPDVVTDSRYSEESGARAMSEILARGQERPTAIFGANDMLAVGCYGALDELSALKPSFVSVTYRGGASSRSRTYGLWWRSGRSTWQV